MKLRLLTLGTEPSLQVRESQAAIEHAFKLILDEYHAFNTFFTEEEFLNELGDAIANDYIVVLGCEPALYTAFKKFISNSFKLKTKSNKAVLKRIEEKHPELDADAVAEQAFMPASATPLLSQDGIYSGFGIKTKKQILIVLPLDDKRIDHIINRGLHPYIRANMDMSLFAADPLKDLENKENKLQERNPEPVPELYDAEFIKNTVDKLVSKNLTVAVANTKTVDFLGNISTTTVDLSKTIFVSPYFVEKGELSGREYAVDLSRGALQNSSNNIGASITKVFSAKDEDGSPKLFMYVCIADKENANIAKLVAEPGETPPQLIYKAVEELFRMLDMWADTGYAIPQVTKDVVVKSNKSASASDEKNKKIKIIVSGIIGATAAVAAGLAIFSDSIFGMIAF